MLRNWADLNNLSSNTHDHNRLAQVTATFLCRLSSSISNKAQIALALGYQPKVRQFSWVWPRVKYILDQQIGKLKRQLQEYLAVNQLDY